MSLVSPMVVGTREVWMGVRARVRMLVRGQARAGEGPPANGS